MLVLIVDDNPTNAKLQKILMESAGWEVLVAGDAEQALALLRGKRPDLVLMDLQLPGMDGFELTTHIRSLPAFVDLPIVAVTAYAMNGDDARALAAGCDGYVTKPINTRSFAETVTRFVPHSVAANASLSPGDADVGHDSRRR